MADLGSIPIAELVDKGYKLKAKVDEAELELDAIKAEIRTRAKKNKKDHFIGNNHFVSVSPRTVTTCEPDDLYNAYADIGRAQDFFKAVSVTIGTAKKDLGETVFGEISEVTTIPYNNVGFKPKVPKKYAKK